MRWTCFCRRAEACLEGTRTSRASLLARSASTATLRASNRLFSLRNLEVQERFRKHVDEKLQRWSSAHPSGNAQAEARKRRLEELSIILLDFREHSRLSKLPGDVLTLCSAGKLREGVTSSRRTDAFACEGAHSSLF